MPCGGIYPIELPTKYLPGEQPDCMVCVTPWRPNDDYTYFCDEWDCWIHRECIHEFLVTDEGRCVIAHCHEIVIREEEPEKEMVDGPEEKKTEGDA